MAQPKHDWRTVRAVGVEQIAETHRSLEADGFTIDFRQAEAGGAMTIVAKRPLPAAKAR